MMIETANSSQINFNSEESFEIEEKFILKIKYNEKLMLFEIEEKNIFPKEDYSIYLSLEELKKLDKYFLGFETLKDVHDSLKLRISKKNLSIIKEERKMKIRLINPINEKEFFINLPLKEKDIKSEINSIIPYIASLNE